LHRQGPTRKRPRPAAALKPREKPPRSASSAGPTASWGSTRKRLRSLQQKQNHAGRPDRGDAREPSTAASRRSTPSGVKLRPPAAGHVHVRSRPRTRVPCSRPRSFAQLMTRWDFPSTWSPSRTASSSKVVGRRRRRISSRPTKTALQTNSFHRARDRERGRTHESAKLASLRQQKAQGGGRASSRSGRVTRRPAAELERTAKTHPVAARRPRTEAPRKRARKAEERRPQSPALQAATFAKGMGQLDWPVRGGPGRALRDRDAPALSARQIHKRRSSTSAGPRSARPSKAVAKGRVGLRERRLRGHWAA